MLTPLSIGCFVDFVSTATVGCTDRVTTLALEARSYVSLSRIEMLCVRPCYRQDNKHYAFVANR